MKKLLCIVGETARGKDTAVRYLQEQFNLKPVISYTTREKRKNETEGKEHYFINDETANELLSHPEFIIAKTQIGKYKYFSTKEELMQSDMYIIDPIGLDTLNYDKDEVQVYILYITSQLSVARERAKKRGDNLQVWEERVIAESEQFKDFNNYDIKLSNNGSKEEFLNALHAVGKAFIEA